MTKILCLSDVETGLINGEKAKERFSDVDLIISCGDLSMSYLDYAATVLNAPLYYVLGNHHPSSRKQSMSHYPASGYNLDGRCCHHENKLLIAGIEGSIRYNNGPHQYTQTEMWMKVISLIPRLLLNKLFYGRYLDIFVTHAPPWQIHDQTDLPHHGIKAFRWLDKTFSPRIHLHGHIHIYRQETVRETVYYKTRIINCYGFREIQLDSSEDR